MYKRYLAAVAVLPVVLASCVGPGGEPARETIAVTHWIPSDPDERWEFHTGLSMDRWRYRLNDPTQTVTCWLEMKTEEEAPKRMIMGKSPFADDPPAGMGYIAVSFSDPVTSPDPPGFFMTLQHDDFEQRAAVPREKKTKYYVSQWFSGPIAVGEPARLWCLGLTPKRKELAMPSKKPEDWEVVITLWIEISPAGRRRLPASN